MSRSPLNRRVFLQSAAGLTAAATIAPYFFTGESSLAAESTAKNDRPHVGLDRRGRTRPRGHAGRRPVRRHRGRLRRRSPAGRKRQDRHSAASRSLPGLPQAARSQGHRRHHQRHARPLAHGRQHRRLQGGQGRLRRKAADADDRRRQAPVPTSSRRPAASFRSARMQRSDPQFQTAVELVRNGRIGKLQQVWVALPYFSTKGGPFATQPVPAELELGPVPRPGAGARLLPCSGRTPISAGGTNTPAASSPTGATTTSTSPTGAWIAT